MNIRLVLSKCFSLIYRENQLKKVSVSSKEFVLNTIKDIDIGDDSFNVNPEGRKIIGIRNIIVEMCRMTEDDIFDSDQILQELRIACDDDSALYDAIKDDITIVLDEQELNTKIINLRHQVQQLLKEDEIKKILSKANSTIKYRPYEIKNMQKYLTGLISELDPYVADIEEKKDPAVMGEISLTDGEGVLDVLREIRDEAKGDSTLRFPWQCMNLMTRGGIRRGQMTTVAALQHHNKSGFSLASCLGFCLYNDPQKILTDKEKKPLILYISFENELDKILGDVYTFLKGNLEDIAITDDDLAKIQVNIIKNYISEHTGRNGYEFKIMRVNPSEWTYMDLFNTINWYEREGYEMHVCCIDYLNQIPKTGCNGDGEPAKIQDLYNRVRNFFSKKNIAVITPHQLSGEALELHRQGRQDLALIVSDGNYYAGCKGIGREVDLEIFLHLIKDSGKVYQAVARGKHRLTGVTNQEHLNYIIPFEEVGGLRFDVEAGPEGFLAIKKIGQRRGNNNELIDPFWE